MIHAELPVPMGAGVRTGRGLFTDSADTTLRSEERIVFHHSDTIAVLEVSLTVFSGASTAFTFGPACLVVVSGAKTTGFRGFCAVFGRTLGPFPLAVVANFSVRGVWVLSVVVVVALATLTLASPCTCPGRLFASLSETTVSPVFKPFRRTHLGSPSRTTRNGCLSFALTVLAEVVVIVNTESIPFDR